MKTTNLVKDVMTKQPVTVPPGTNLQQCAKIMSDLHVGSLLVKDGPGVVGIITEQDLVRKCVLKNVLPSKTLVDDIMESNLIVVREEQNIEEAITLMRDHNVRHLPVMNKKEQFVGFITGKDILKIQPELFKLLAEKMRK